MGYRKLGRTSDQRKAILRTLTTALLWTGHIETTETRAKEVRAIAEKFITLAARECDNTVTVQKAGKKYTNDAPSKLAARRAMIAYLYNIPQPKGEREKKSEYRERTGHINNPVVEKLFREIGPKYKKRAADLGTGGGYTRIVKLGPRRGDGAPMALLELV